MNCMKGLPKPGGAMYIRKTSSIKSGDTVYKNSFAYIMPRDRSIDIDTELDFIMAESIMNIRNHSAKEGTN